MISRLRQPSPSILTSSVYQNDQNSANGKKRKSLPPPGSQASTPSFIPLRVHNQNVANDIDNRASSIPRPSFHCQKGSFKKKGGNLEQLPPASYISIADVRSGSSNNSNFFSKSNSVSTQFYSAVQDSKRSSSKENQITSHNASYQGEKSIKEDINIQQEESSYEESKDSSEQSNFVVDDSSKKFLHPQPGGRKQHYRYLSIRESHGNLLSSSAQSSRMEDQDIREALLTVPLQPGESFSIEHNNQNQLVNWNKTQSTGLQPIISAAQQYDDDDDYDEQEDEEDEEEDKGDNYEENNQGNEEENSQESEIEGEQNSKLQQPEEYSKYEPNLFSKKQPNKLKHLDQQENNQQYSSDQRMVCSPEFSGDLINSNNTYEKEDQQSSYQEYENEPQASQKIQQPPVIYQHQLNNSYTCINNDSVMISKRVLSDLYTISSQLDSIVYKTILDSDVLFQQAHNLKNNLLSPGQKQNPINLLMTIQQQSSEQQLKQQTISPTYQEACRQNNRLITQNLINSKQSSNQKMHFDLLSMLARCKSRVNKFNLAQKGIVDYYKQTVKGLRSELRIFATSLQQLQIQNARKQVEESSAAKNKLFFSSPMPALDSVRSEIEEMLNQVTVERDLLKHQVEQQSILEQRVKSHYLSKLTNVQLENNTMCAKYEAQIANLTTQVEKMSLELKKLRDLEKSKAVNVSSSCATDLLNISQEMENVQNADLRDRIKQLTNNYGKLRDKFNKSKNQYEEQIDELENKQRKLQKENRLLTNQIQDLKSMQKYSPTMRSSVSSASSNMFSQYDTLNTFSVGGGNGQKLFNELRFKLQQTEYQLNQNRCEKNQMRKDYQEKLKNKEQEKDQLTEQLKGKFQLLQNKIADAYRQKQTAENENQHQNENYQRIQAENQKLTNTINDMVTDNNKRKKELMQLQFDIKDRQIQASALQTHVQKLVENLQKKDENVRDLQAEFNELRECYQIVLNQRNLAIEKLQMNEEGHLNILEELQKQLQQRQQKIEISNEQLQRKSQLEQLIIKASMDIKAKQNQICSYQKQTQEIQKAVEQLENLQKDYNGVNQQNQILSQKYKALEELRLNENQESKKMLEENKNLSQKITQITKKLEQVCNHGQILKSKYIELQNKEKKGMQELTSIKTTVVSELQKDIAIKTTGLEKAQTVIQRLNDESQKMDQAMNRMQEKIQEIEYKNKELVQTNSQLAQRASAGEVLKNMNDSVNNQNNRLKKLLEENQEQWNENEEKWESQRIEMSKKIENLQAESTIAEKTKQEQAKLIEQSTMQIEDLTTQIDFKQKQMVKNKQSQQVEKKESQIKIQSLVDKLEMLQKHSSKAFYHLISKFPKTEQNKFIRNNISLAKMLQCIQEFQGMTDDFEFTDFLTADKMHKDEGKIAAQEEMKKAPPMQRDEQQDRQNKMKKYAKILTTTKRNKYASEKSCNGAIDAKYEEVAPCNRQNLKSVVQNQHKEEFQNEMVHKFDFNKPIAFDDCDKLSIEDSFAIIGGADNKSSVCKINNPSKSLNYQTLKLMNMTIQSDFNALSKRYISMGIGLKKIIEVQQKAVQQQKKERDEQTQKIQLERKKAQQEKIQVMLKQPKHIIIHPDIFKALFNSTKAQLVQASNIVSAYRSQNNSLKAMLRQHIEFLRKGQKISEEENNDTTNNSINFAELIIPEIQSVRKQKTQLIRSNQTLLSQLQNLKSQLDDRNKQLSQCTSMSQENVNLKKALEMSKNELQKLISRTMKRSDMVQQSLAVVYNLNSKIRTQISSSLCSSSLQVPPLNIPIRKADEAELITQVNQLAKRIDSVIKEVAVHRDQNLELSSKNKKTYEAAMRQLQTEIIMERRKVKESEQKYHRDLVKQEGEWQKERARLLDVIKNNACNLTPNAKAIDTSTSNNNNNNTLLYSKTTVLLGEDEDDNDKSNFSQLQNGEDELSIKIKHLNYLLNQKNTQLKCLQRQNQVLSLKCEQKMKFSENQENVPVREAGNSEMVGLLRNYTRLQTEYKQLNEKYDQLRQQKAQVSKSSTAITRKQNQLFSLNASCCPVQPSKFQVSQYDSDVKQQGNGDSKYSKIMSDYKSLKAKKDNDKKRFKRRAREFESVLRLLEIKMAFITSSDYQMKNYKNYNIQKLTEIKRDVAKKNPNLSQWLHMMESFILRIQNSLRTLRSSFHWIYRGDYLKLEKVPLNVFVCEMGTNLKLQQQFESQLLSKCEKLDRIKANIDEQLTSREDIYQMPAFLSMSQDGFGEMRAPYKSAEEFLKHVQGTLNFQNENLKQYFESSGRDYKNEKQGRLSGDISPPDCFEGQDSIKKGGAFGSFVGKDSCILIDQQQQNIEEIKLKENDEEYTFQNLTIGNVDQENKNMILYGRKNEEDDINVVQDQCRKPLGDFKNENGI